MQTRRSIRTTALRCLRGAFCVLVCSWLIAPTLIAIPLSFSSAPFLQFPPPGWSLQWYEKLFTDPMWTRSIVTSIKVTTVATVTATLLGTSAALAIVRSQGRLLRLLNILLLTPMIVPIIITATAIFAVFQSWQLIGSITGLILAHTVLAIPFVVVTVTAAPQTIDVRLEHAAASLGASPRAIFRHIVVPLAFPGILAGALFALITSLDELVVSLFISTAAVRPVTVQIWSDVRGAVDPTVASLSTILFLLSLMITILTEGLRRMVVKYQAGGR